VTIDRHVGKTYLTAMSAQTRLSAKGQVVIPKDVRDRIGLAVGETFDVIERNDEVVLKRRKSRHARRTAAEALAEIHSFYRYGGPRLSDEDIRMAVAKAIVRRHQRASSRGG
jgi:AbrB family looped-hinge helix DNA binding protein